MFIVRTVALLLVATALIYFATKPEKHDFIWSSSLPFDTVAFGQFSKPEHKMPSYEFPSLPDGPIYVQGIYYGCLKGNVVKSSCSH